MEALRRSRYLRAGPENRLVRLLLARTMSRASDEQLVCDYSFDSRVARYFDTSGIDLDTEDPAEVRRWLDAVIAEASDVDYDPDDPFTCNTREIADTIGLSDVELRLLRFGFLLTATGTLDRACDTVNAEMSAFDVVDFLAAVLDEDVDAVASALTRHATLRRSGLMTRPAKHQHVDLRAWMCVPSSLGGFIFDALEDRGQVVAALFRQSPSSRLEPSDYDHVAERVGLLQRYLSGALEAGAAGVNVLLWGPPGTGKTELARLLAASCGTGGFEIATVDDDGDAIRTEERFRAYRLAQTMLEHHTSSLVIFDEVEDVISDAGYGDHGYHSPSSLTKGLINRTLEANPIPAVWITNTLGDVDPAFLRRFGVVLQLERPAESAKRGIAARTFEGLGVGTHLVERVLGRETLGPAHLEKARRVCELAGAADPAAVEATLVGVFDGDLRAVGEPGFEAAVRGEGSGSSYDARLVTADADLAHLADALAREDVSGTAPALRICLYGPPGTGKTAWAHRLAERTGRPLVVAQQHELQSAYVGESEKAIARKFRDAERQGAVLVFDEVDSFLQDRKGATRHHEVQAVNQFLTSLEAYEGVLVCTTNRLDDLDAATLRRFDVKVHLDYLDTNGLSALLDHLAGALGLETDELGLARASRRLSGARLTPGNAAALLRRYRALRETPALERVVDDLLAESGLRSDGPAGTMGFLATGS